MVGCGRGAVGRAGAGSRRLRRAQQELLVEGKCGNQSSSLSGHSRAHLRRPVRSATRTVHAAVALGVGHGPIHAVVVPDAGEPGEGLASPTTTSSQEPLTFSNTE